MFTTTRSRRSAWTAGLAISALTTSLAMLAAPPGHAQDLIAPVTGDYSCAQLPEEEVVFDPGGSGGELGGGLERSRGAASAASIEVLSRTAPGILRAAFPHRAAPTLVAQSGPRKDLPVTDLVANPAGLSYRKTTIPEADVKPRWGLTELGDLDVRRVIRCVNPAKGTWRATVRGVVDYEQGVRLLDNVTEATATLVTDVATSSDPVAQRCTDLVKISDDLLWESWNAGTGVAPIGPLPRPLTPTRFYMISAVQAHEDVHVQRLKKAMFQPWTAYKNAMDSAVVAAPTRAEANAHFNRLHTAAAQQLLAALKSYTDAPEHADSLDFIRAEQRTVAPRVAQIKAWRDKLGCPQVG